MIDKNRSILNTSKSLNNLIVFRSKLSALTILGKRHRHTLQLVSVHVPLIPILPRINT